MLQTIIAITLNKVLKYKSSYLITRIDFEIELSRI